MWSIVLAKAISLALRRATSCQWSIFDGYLPLLRLQKDNIHATFNKLENKLHSQKLLA